jgi:hypothetical protein
MFISIPIIKTGKYIKVTVFLIKIIKYTLYLNLTAHDTFTYNKIVFVKGFNS